MYKKNILMVTDEDTEALAELKDYFTKTVIYEDVHNWRS